MTSYADLEKDLREWAVIARGQGDRTSLEPSPNFSAEARADIKAGFYAQEKLLTKAADAIAALTKQVEESRDALKVFADCAVELEGSEDVPRAPDGEWAKFRLLTDDYRRAAQVYARLSRATREEETPP